MTTTTANLHLRTGAGTSNRSLRVIPDNTPVTVTGPATNVGSTPWYPLIYDGTAGWSSGDYLANITLPPVRLTVAQGIRKFFGAILPLQGRWYEIGGNGPKTFDCSGLVLFILRLLGFDGAGPDRTANSIMHEFRAGRFKGKLVELADARPGDIAFFGWHTRDADGNPDDHASHVVFMISPVLCIGANGGNDQMDTEQEAIDRDAKVRIDLADYRETAPWPHRKDRLEIWRPDYGWED